MDIGDAIEAAIRDLALAHRVVRLSAEAAAKAISDTEAQFVARSTARWWWEHLRPGLPLVGRHRSGDDGYRLLPVVCPDQPTWLFASDDEDPPWPVFRGTPSDFSRVIAECRAFEYILADPDLKWLVIENHHAEVFAVGEPVASTLAQHDG